MKYLATVLLLICAATLFAEEAQAPTWNGLVCIGWSKSQDKALADGDSEGEELVINTPLTASERKRLYLARQVSHAAFEAEEAIQKEIIKNHGYSPKGSTGSEGPCGEFIMIRADEYHITQFVPSNPAYPGTGQYVWFMQQEKSRAECRTYFAELRRKAVTATYGGPPEHP